MRTRLIIASVFLISLFAKPLLAQQIISGVVFSDTNKNGKKESREKGIANVSVSNGIEVTQTDKDGKYNLPVSKGDVVFVIKPNGYNLPLKSDNTPNFYNTQQSKNKVNFGLIPSKEVNEFKVLLFGDADASTDKKLGYFKSIVDDAKKQAHKPLFGISLGNMVGQNSSLIPKYKKIIRKLSVPWFNVIGSDDKNNLSTENAFKKAFGPANYSFNYGNGHFIILDNVLQSSTKETIGGFSIDQLQFLQNDLSFVDKDKLVVIALHIPLIDNEKAPFNDFDKKKLFDVLKPFSNVLIVSGHTHIQQNFHHNLKEKPDNEKTIYEYNIGSTSGDWYSGEKDTKGMPVATMRDGTPKGYAILNISDNKYSINYKAYNRNLNDQFDVTLPKVMSLTRRKRPRMMVNFFMGDINSTVQYKINDTPYVTMRKSKMYDWNYVSDLIKWDENTSTNNRGNRPSSPIQSSHIWVADIRNIEKTGKHNLTVKATDRYGNEFVKTTVIMVD